MANFDLIFKAYDDDNFTIQAKVSFEHIEIICSNPDENTSIFLDKSTAIKFAKTLRTEINKITESEVSNG